MDGGSEDVLWEGARVTVHSLVRAPEHNGVRGKTGAFNASTGRWPVHIEPGGRVLALQPANLALLCCHTECSEPLRPPLLRFATCKAVAYCSKGVGWVGFADFSRSFCMRLRKHVHCVSMILFLLFRLRLHVLMKYISPIYVLKCTLFA